jgi:hypothetical protein
MFRKAMFTCALALTCVLACATDDSDLPEVGAMQETEEFRASYYCAGGEEIYEFTSELVDVRGVGWEDAEPFYCLTRCEGHHDMSRARKTAVHNPSSRTDSWCLSYAAYYCARLDRELESWCWGTREEDDD